MHIHVPSKVDKWNGIKDVYWKPANILKLFKLIEIFISQYEYLESLVIKRGEILKHQ
jgi:hypothetical protein